MRLFGFGKRPRTKDCSEPSEPEYLPYTPMYPGRARPNSSPPKSTDEGNPSLPEESGPEVPHLLIFGEAYWYLRRPWYKKAWEKAKRLCTAGMRT